MILGHIVTHIALHKGLIDLTNNNLHKACDLLPLDLMSLDDMGLLCKNGAMSSLYPPCPIIPQLNRVFKKGVICTGSIIPTLAMTEPPFDAQ